MTTVIQREPGTPAASPLPALLTMEQVAARLGTSVRFVRRLRAERRLAFVKIGKHLRVDLADLESFIDAHRERPDLLPPRLSTTCSAGTRSPGSCLIVGGRLTATGE